MHISSWIPQLRSSAAREAPAASTRGEGADGATNASHHQSVIWQRTIAPRRARARFAERTQSSHSFWQAAACTICEKGRARRASGREERREEQAGTSSVTQKNVSGDAKVRLFFHQIKEIDEHDLLAAANARGRLEKGNYTLVDEVCGGA